MANAIEIKRNLALRRGERFGRYGSLVPVFGMFVVIFSTDLVHYTKAQYFAAVLSAAFAGQVLVWIAMLNLKRCEGWDSGILFYLWSGGLLTSVSVYGTAIATYDMVLFVPALIPWVAPVVGSLARWWGGRGGE
jgi:hypothetical protein